jgi:2-polyprenyl-6-methoxyphenol hydroxylase-like FAD-dependent oxidoreductase
VPNLREAATRVRRMAFVDQRRNHIAEMALPVNSKRQVEIQRKDLAHILCEAAQRDANVLFDDSIAGVEQDGGGVNVTFERAPSRRFDYLIGCDGFHSTVRRLVFGSDRASIADFGLYVSTFPLGYAAESDDEVVMYNEPNRTSSIHPGRGPAIAALMYRSPTVTSFVSGTRNEPCDGRRSRSCRSARGDAK